MTKRLRIAIEAAIASPSVEAVKAIADAYAEDRKSLTVTMQRIEFLEERLLQGDNKRVAAIALTKHDHRLNQGTAESLVYTVFSGMFQNPRKRRRASAEVHPPIVRQSVADVTAEGDLL